MISGVAEGYVKIQSTKEVVLDFSKITKQCLDSNLPLCCEADKRLSDKELATYVISLMKEVDKANYQEYRYGYEQKRTKGKKGSWDVIIYDAGE